MPYASQDRARAKRQLVSWVRSLRGSRDKHPMTRAPGKMNYFARSARF